MSGGTKPKKPQPHNTHKQRAERREQNAKRRQEIAERRRQVFTYKKMGYTHREIAAMLSMSIAQVSRDIENALQGIYWGDAKQYRDLELARLDDMRNIVWPQMQAGDLFAVDRALQITDRTVRLLGLDRLPADDGAKDAKAALVEFLANATKAAMEMPEPE